MCKYVTTATTRASDVVWRSIGCRRAVGVAKLEATTAEEVLGDGVLEGAVVQWVVPLGLGGARVGERFVHRLAKLADARVQLLDGNGRRCNLRWNETERLRCGVGVRCV